jgi:recombination protein RecT
MTNNQLSVKNYLNSPTVQEKIKTLLKDKSQSFVVSLLSTVNTNKELANCDPQSVLSAAMTAAALDLPINQNLGYAYIIPYKGLAQFQIGWKGFIQLAQRSGQFKTINVSDVRENEIKDHNHLTGDIEFAWLKENREKTPIVGYVGYMELVNGFNKTFYMSVSDIRQHGMKYSQTFKKGFGVWKDNFEAMAHKTIIKLMLAKYAPLSVDLQKATVYDQAVIKENDEIEYVDNTPEDPRQVAQEKEIEKLVKHIQNAKTISELEACKDALHPDVEGLYADKYIELEEVINSK